MGISKQALPDHEICINIFYTARPTRDWVAFIPKLICIGSVIYFRSLGCKLYTISYLESQKARFYYEGIYSYRAGDIPP